MQSVPTVLSLMLAGWLAGCALDQMRTWSNACIQFLMVGLCSVMLIFSPACYCSDSHSNSDQVWVKACSAGSSVGNAKWSWLVLTAMLLLKDILAFSSSQSSPWDVLQPIPIDSIFKDLLWQVMQLFLYVIYLACLITMANDISILTLNCLFAMWSFRKSLSMHHGYCSHCSVCI